MLKESTTLDSKKFIKSTKNKLRSLNWSWKNCLKIDNYIVIA